MLNRDYEGRWVEFVTPDGKTVAIEQFSLEGTPPTLALETDGQTAAFAPAADADALQALLLPRTQHGRLNFPALWMGTVGIVDDLVQGIDV